MVKRFRKSWSITTRFCLFLLFGVIAVVIGIAYLLIHDSTKRRNKIAQQYEQLAMPTSFARYEKEEGCDGWDYGLCWDYSYTYSGTKSDALSLIRDQLRHYGFDIFTSDTKPDLFFAWNTKRYLMLEVGAGSIDVGRGGPLEHHDVIFVTAKSTLY